MKVKEYRDCRLVNGRAVQCDRAARLLSRAIRRAALPPKQPPIGAVEKGLAVAGNWLFNGSVKEWR